MPVEQPESKAPVHTAKVLLVCIYIRVSRRPGREYRFVHQRSRVYISTLTMA